MTPVFPPQVNLTRVYSDEREDKINSGNCFTDMTGYPDMSASWRFHFDFPGSYHHRACGFSFADGHAEIKKWLDERTVPPIQAGASWSSAEYVAAVGYLLHRTRATEVTAEVVRDATRRSMARRHGISAIGEAFDRSIRQRAPREAAELAAAEADLAGRVGEEAVLLAAARRLHDLAYPARATR